ncbi:MAG: carboxypeptidase-like regulatory domain-containing protein [Acidobacteriia bacterium]|nr:carboxypeptidase-like regulatory domain-containing protein [Terriglobia bacterium]
MKSMIRRSAIVAALVLSLFAASNGRAQTGTTSLRGTVLDKSGAVVVGAKVTLANPAQAFERVGTSNEAGTYEFVALPPGTYTLTVEMQGFRKHEQKNLQLLVNTPATVNVTLNIGAATETVEVLAQAVAINTTDASLGIAFNENQVKQLPMEGRNVPDLLSLQAGVTYTGNRSDVNRNVDTRSGAVNGAHSDQSNVTLDGVDVNDQTNGYAFTSVLPVTLDSVQEFRVTTTNYNADQGRSSGAQISLVTKSGTNDFHGSLYEYHRNTVTSANDYFVKQAELSQGNPNVPPKLLRNNFGGSVGGPAWKNRLFFFANFEAARQREENSVLRIVPSLAMRDGIIMYACNQTDPNYSTLCNPNSPGSITGAHGTYTVPVGYYALSPTQMAAMDPQGLGPSQLMMQHFQNDFPAPNDLTAGDRVNYVGFRFPGPVPTNNNWYIARADYKITSSGSHTVFWRGALRNDTHGDVPYLPGQGPELNQADYSKGFTVGYTGTLRPTLLNNFRWGFTRQSYGQIGNSSQPVIYFRGLNDNSTSNNSSRAVTRTNAFQVPVHNLVDDVSWSKRKHTIQFGTNIAFIRNPKLSTLSSFSSASTNASWLSAAGIANKGSYMDPAISGLPAVDSGFANNYDYPLIALMGAITEVDATFNYKKDGSVLPQGTPLTRHFAVNSYEFYVQDSWKVKPNLTVIYGLRYSLFSPPWETNGLEVTPTFSLGDWFMQRARNMVQGIGSFADPLVAFDLAGPANGKPGFYNWDKKDFGPRIGVAWSPSASEGFLKSLLGGPGKSSIRAGFGIVYDRIGQGLLSTFDRRGSFGMSSTLTSGNGLINFANSPRVGQNGVGLNTIPLTDTTGTIQLFPANPPAGGFPQTFPWGNQNGAYAATWGLDSSIKTPYSYTLDLSVGRELPRDFFLEVSYVGRLSHRLLVQEDLAQPADLVDPKTHIDYYTAAQALAKIYSQPNAPAPGAITPQMVGPTAQYWYDMTQPAGAYADVCGLTTTTDALQANYALFSCFAGNETTAIQGLDQGWGLTDPSNGGASVYGNCGATGGAVPNPHGLPNCYVNSQYASVYAWRSIGTASYHALQVSLRKRMSHGVQFDLNYTFSKSLDLESDAERVDSLGAGSLGMIFNAWQPKQLRAVSDFDTPHQINANWIVELPFGKGKVLGKNVSGLMDAVIGGWQLSGLARWTSGFPVSISNGATWPTNWDFGGNASKIGAVVTGTTKNPDGSVNLFPNPQGPTGIGAFRHAYPGESGIRNFIRGDGFAGLDMSLTKRWKMPWKESHSLQFRWEVFNVPNLQRFDVQTVTTGIDQVGSFGQYSGLLTNPRVMQFALRYEF